MSLASCLLMSAVLGVAALTCAASQDDEEVYSIGAGVTPPRLVRRVEPTLPSDSKGFRVNGTVVIRMVVTSKGSTRDVRVVESLDKEVDQAAVKAVEQWKFDPARKKDQAVAVRVTVEIRFRDM